MKSNNNALIQKYALAILILNQAINKNGNYSNEMPDSQN